MRTAFPVELFVHGGNHGSLIDAGRAQKIGDLPDLGRGVPDDLIVVHEEDFDIIALLDQTLGIIISFSATLTG